MRKFDCMESTVKEIVRSLREDPTKWSFETITFRKRGTGIEYWVSPNCQSITCVWNGRTTHKVFSYEQGCEIYQAYMLARSTVASELQSKIIRCFANDEASNLKQDTSPWWKFWK